MIVIDTHVLIWFADGDSRLSPKLRQMMEDRPSDVLVPSICIWEALLMVERGRLTVGEDDPSTTLKGYIEKSGFVETPLTVDIAVLSRTLPFQHNDPADRFIAATAYANSAFLATYDSNLRKLPWVRFPD